MGEPTKNSAVCRIFMAYLRASEGPVCKHGILGLPQPGYIRPDPYHRHSPHIKHRLHR